MIYKTLNIIDPEVNKIIELEEQRQKNSLELIASENFTSISVLQTESSILNNIYNEYSLDNNYLNIKHILELETLCKYRALQLFNLNSEIWDVNIYPLSGSNANLAVYLALIGKNGRLMGLDLPSGGHLTHGYKTVKKKVSASSIFFESKLYKSDNINGIDYNNLEKEAKQFQPQIIICGASAYSLDFNYKKLREIAGNNYLMADISHISGFIAYGLMKNAFEYADIITMTTHFLLRGPRGGMIFYKKRKIINNISINVKYLIDNAIFPQLNDWPQIQKLAGLAVSLKQALSPEYKQYCKQVLNNAKIMAETLKNHGCTIIYNKTECNLFLITYKGVNGAEIQRICELANISVNKNCITGDTSPMEPSAIKIGLSAMTTRGFLEKDAIEAGNLVFQAIQIAVKIKQQTKTKNEFNHTALNYEEITQLKTKVITFLKPFPFPVFTFKI